MDRKDLHMSWTQLTDFIAAAQRIIPQFADFLSAVHIAGLIIALKPLSVRMSRVRPAEKEALQALAEARHG
jgi:hypothetical protein